MKIGIPQGLTFYWFYPFWKSFFKNLGLEVITSGPSTRQIIAKGCRAALNETCLPVKTFIGHALELKDKIDALFIPSLKSCESGRYFCPKIIALPETISNSVTNSILTLVIDNYDHPLNAQKKYLQFAKELGFSHLKAEQAFKDAQKMQRLYEQFLLKGCTPLQAIDLLTGYLGITEQNLYFNDSKKNTDYTIAVLGHPYLVYDSLLNLNLIKKLAQFGVQVVTADILTEKVLAEHTSFLSKDLFWTYPRRLVAGASYYSKEDIDGIIFLSCFSCGTDAIIEPFILEMCEDKVPFLKLTLDEHTGEAGFNTRLEAFIDMLKREKRCMKNESSISLYG